jgi:hypothetical protein
MSMTVRAPTVTLNSTARGQRLWAAALALTCQGTSLPAFAADALGDDAEDLATPDVMDEPSGSEEVVEGTRPREPGDRADLTAPPVAELEAPQRSDDAEYLLGVRYRGIIIPKFVLGLFIDGGKDIYVNGFGPELAIVKGNVEYNLSAWVALYDMSPVAIKGSSNEEEAWEIISADMTAVYATGDFLWRTPLTGNLDFTYGGSGGVGVLFGDLFRTQAYLMGGGSEGTADDYLPCTAQDQPSFQYCDDANAHYPGYSEPGWFNGGSKPVLFPWITGQVGLRYQMHEKFVTRLDIGVGTSGLYFGVGADYAL